MKIEHKPRRLSENGYFSQSLRQDQIIILEILKCIPVVIIFAFLDLETNFSFSDSLLDRKFLLDISPDLQVVKFVTVKVCCFLALQTVKMMMAAHIRIKTTLSTVSLNYINNADLREG